MARPEVSVIVTTYQMPRHLQRVLASIARQTVVGQLEVIVTDDGSTDETPEVVRRFARSSGLDVEFASHRHANPQLDEEIFPLKLTAQEKSDLVTFLKEGLSSESYPDVEPPELPK